MAQLTFTVDYSRKIADVLQAAGIRERAEARLGVFGAGIHPLKAELLTFDRDVTAPSVLGRMKEMKLRPATFFELASAAEADRKLGTKTRVVAIGSCDVNYNGGSASPAIATVAGERTITMTKFCGAWPKDTAFLALPVDMPAGHTDVAHNHLFPIEKKRSPKLVFDEPVCSVNVDEVHVDGTIRALAKKAKIRNVADSIDKPELFAQTGDTETVSMTIFTGNRLMKKAEVIAELAANGQRPATARELVAMVVAQPDIMDTRSIWAFGDVGYAGVYKAGGRTLGVHVGMTEESPWELWCWFASVRR